MGLSLLYGALGKMQSEKTPRQPDFAPRDLAWFRVVVVLAIVTTVGITWPLWNQRDLPALLPVAPLPSLSLGLPLVVASASALAAPRAGTLAVTLIVAYGMAADQTRMQPEFFSLPILLWGTLPHRSPRLIARVHLIALWFYSGFHKLLSADYLADAGPLLVNSLPLPLPEQALPIAVVGIAVLEIGTAVMAFNSETRHYAAWSAFVLHAGILIAFSPLAEMRNPAVWPWNIALALSGFALIAPWRTSLLTDLRLAPFATRIAVAALLVMPLGFYAGIVDAYPAHHLYSAATASATIHCPAGCRPEQDVNATWHALNVPMPPQPRLFKATFAKTCAPGDMLKVVDRHPPPWDKNSSNRAIPCPAGSLPAAHP